MWERGRGALPLSLGFSNSNINLSFSSLCCCAILRRKKKSVIKILNLCIPISTPPPHPLPSKKKMYISVACPFAMILPYVGFLSGITAKSGKGLGHSSLLQQLPRGQLGTDSLRHRPVATDAIALKSSFPSPLTSRRKNENGKCSDILCSFLLLVLGNRTEATYDWNEMRFFLANKHCTCRISTKHA